MKLFSKASEYAIRAMMQVVESDAFPSFSPKDICSEAGIPEAFGRKALWEMAKGQIIKGTPGPGGGYQFVREPSEISLLDIVLAVDGQNAFAECPMGKRCQAQSEDEEFHSCDKCALSSPKCELSNLCPMHQMWREIRQFVISHLETTTLEDIKNRRVGFSLS